MTYAKSAGWVVFIAVLALVSGQREPAAVPALASERSAVPPTRLETAEPRGQATLVDSRGRTAQDSRVQRPAVATSGT